METLKESEENKINVEEIIQAYGEFVINYRMYTVNEISKFLIRKLDKMHYGFTPFIEYSYSFKC